MQDAPISETEVKNLRYLRILVTTLTVTMILGLLTIVALLVIRFTTETTPVVFPESIEVPDGTTVTAFTQGSDWYGAVTGDDEILIFDRATGALRQTIKIEPKSE